MDFQQQLDAIFEEIKSALSPKAEYISYSIPSYSGNGSSGKSYFSIIDGKPDYDSVPDALKTDRANRNNDINKRIRNLQNEIAASQKPGRFVVFSISKESGYSFRIASPEELVALAKFDLMRYVDPGTRKEIFAEVIADEKSGIPDVVATQKIYQDNGEVTEYTGAPIDDFARAAFHALDEKLQYVYALVSPTEVVIKTSPAIPRVTELYETGEDSALDASRIENIYGFLESFNKAKIEKGLEALNANPEFKAEAEKRYGQLIKIRVGAEAGIESFEKAALTRKESELFSHWNFSENVISLSRRDQAECQAIVDFIGSLVMSHLDIDSFKRQMEAAETETEIRTIYSEAAQKVKNGMLAQANVYRDGWFGKTCGMLANHKVEKLVFEKTDFRLENSGALKAFVFYLALNNCDPVYFDIFQSYVSDLSEFFWFLPSVPQTAWGDTELSLPANTLKIRRSAEYRLEDDGPWLQTS